MKLLLYSLVMFFMAESALAREIGLYRRITVFPIAVDNQYLEVAEKTWWELRKSVTKDKRFLVATQSFLQKKDAYLARKSLRPSDAIILGRLLDAQVLVTLELAGRDLKLKAYEGENGQEIWLGERNLHPSQPIAEQLQKASLQLLQDFVSSWPYQGFVVEDKFVGEVIYREEDKRLIKVKMGLGSQAQPGDPVEFLQLSSKSLRPLFQGGMKESLLAQGRVLYVDNEIITVQLERVSEKAELKTGVVAKLPKEFQRLRDLFAGSSDNLPTVSTMSTGELPPIQKEIEEKKAFTTALAFLGSLAVFLVLAL